MVGWGGVGWGRQHLPPPQVNISISTSFFWDAELLHFPLGVSFQQQIPHICKRLEPKPEREPENHTQHKPTL